MHSYDSDERVKRRDIAEDTLSCIEKGVCGKHPIPNNASKSWVWIEGDECPVKPTASIRGTNLEPTFRVFEGTTLAASVMCRDAPGLGVLNFASARNPGGGFHTGANAQEESLARSTALFPCLEQFEAEMYAPNWEAKSGFYSHTMICSPDVCFFKDDAGDAITPFAATVVSSPAPNVGVLTRKRGRTSAGNKMINTILKERIRRILHCFSVSQCRTLILGAWGCGVFGNDPSMVAALFAQEILKPEFRGAFDNIIFAIIDKSMCDTFNTSLSDNGLKRSAKK